MSCRATKHVASTKSSVHFVSLWQGCGGDPGAETTAEHSRSTASGPQRSAKAERKALLKAVKGYVVAAASNPHGALFLCACLEVVDDTVLLRKYLLSEMLPQLAVLAAQSHGSLPLLAVRRVPRQLLVQDHVVARAVAHD